jgi:ribulose 1,5-bisphosphate carboxylase large subunit-like protein
VVAVRFDELRLPEQTFGLFEGPQFGVEGLAKRFDVKSFPLLMGIVKPSLLSGLTLPQFEERVAAPVAGGFHLVKDDEMLGETPVIASKDRFALARKNGRYVPVLNLDDLEETAKITADESIGMVMVNASVIGFPYLRALRRRSKVPLLSHLAILGIFSPTFSAGMFAFLHRLFGCDAFMTPIGEGGYYKATPEMELDIMTALTEELPVKRSLPILTGGARKSNLEQIAGRHVRSGIPFGVAMGAQIFATAGEPKALAESVISELQLIRQRAGGSGKP